MEILLSDSSETEMAVEINRLCEQNNLPKLGKRAEPPAQTDLAKETLADP